MSLAPRRRWGLGARLLAAIVAVILVAAGTAWAVALAIGPEIFHDHMLMAEPADSSVVSHAGEAFTTAWTLSLSLALLAALLTSVVVSVFLTRRIARSLERVRQAAAQVASGDYAARVPEVHMGTEFDDLAGAFNTMAADLGEIEQTRTRMLGDLAHEMRTPVATLDGYLEGILDGVVAADEPTLGMLREQVARLARLAQDIALVTAAGEGRLRMHWQPLQVGALIDAAAQAAARFTDKGVELTVEATEEARQTVLTADPDRLGQVLTNLLDNAVRHTPHGGRVQLGAQRTGSTLRLSVRDTGSGIAAEHLPHLFERFYRADAARDRAHGGSGIGLTIVHAIVHAHGGAVTATSTGPGHGALFTVELPVDTGTRVERRSS
ncbi:Signal transduction histidine kinase [Georgenia satyanarayanai]|uniref:histidine kinase n=1 Tax=Georgenia satyanarayanai TaxID=860221 RepID=A0A2Y9C133_9MICO|nr:ATP-binding protein [Georgenia satyanarayanai]PYF95904.1 signal transduction histidine kinase [Georgenia satyanarayanai]SSA47312.1 Signal transduction histidine kinase [Georgenia satyanarayanai]